MNIYVCWDCGKIFNIDEKTKDVKRCFNEHKKKGHDVEEIPEGFFR